MTLNQGVVDGGVGAGYHHKVGLRKDLGRKLLKALAPLARDGAARHMGIVVTYHGARGLEQLGDTQSRRFAAV